MTFHPLLEPAVIRNLTTRLSLWNVIFAEGETIPSHLLL